MKRVLAAVLIGLLCGSSAYAADNSITTPDAGKKLDTHDVSTGAGSVHRQGIVVCDPGTNTCAAVTGSGMATNPRALSHTTDSVQIGDGVDILQIDSSGRITVVATGTVTANQGGTWTVQSTQNGTWNVQSTQSGTWSIRMQDGTGNNLTSTGGKLDTNTTIATDSVGLAKDATLTGGNAQAIMRGGAKGGTTAANATVSSVDANTNAVDVFIRGGAGAGGTSAQDNTTFIAGSSAGTPIMGLFKSGSPPAITDGDIGVPMMNSSRQLLVACPTCPGGTGGTAIADKAGFTEGTTQATPVAGVLNETPSADPTEDQAAAVRITAKRGLHANLRNSAGTEVGTSGTPLRIDPTGTTTQPVSIPGTVSVSGTVTANLGTLNSVVTEKAQGSTTSGQSGPLSQGAVTTAAPTYTNAQTNPLSLTTTGDLRVVSTTGLADRTASGNIAGAGQTVAITLQGLQGVSYSVAGTWVATLRCQVSSDGATWVDIDSYAPGSESLQSDVTGNGQFTCDLPGGMMQARVAAIAYTSGTAAINLRANMVPSRGMHSYDRPPGQSLPNHAAWVGGTDGTNLQGFSAFDVDTSGSTHQYAQGVSIRLPGSGGSLAGGTAANPLRVDPTGTTTQPVTVSSGTINVQGPSASGASASGNPVQGGAVFRTTQPTVTNGQVVENQATARGAQIVATGVDTFAVDTELPAASALGDSMSNPTTPLIGASNMVWDGGAWVRAKQASSGMNATEVGVPVAAIVGQFDDASPTTITENQFGIARTTPNRAIHVNLRAQDGTELSVGGGTQYDRDTVAGAADKLTMAGVVRKDTPASLVNADGDRTALQVDSTGRLAINCLAGCASAGDTVGSTISLNALNAAAQVAMSGQRGAEFFIASGTLAATLTPEISLDGGTTYAAAMFLDNTNGTTAATLVFTNPSAVTHRSIVWSGSVTNVRVRVSSFTSGTADATLRAVTNNNAGFLLGSDGSNIRSGAMTSAGLLKVDMASSGNGPVNVAQVNGTTTDSNSGNKSNGTMRVVLATDQPQLTNKLLVTPDANSAVNVAQVGGNTVSTGNGVSGTGVQRVTIASDSTGTVAVTNTGTFAVQDNGATSGGASICYVTSAASTNSTSCKGSAGQIYTISAVNTTATTYYLRLYNSSSAPTCSSATGFIRTIPVLATGGAVEARHVGAAFGTGIGFCLTGGGSSTDNTNAATGVYVTIEYK